MKLLTKVKCKAHIERKDGKWLHPMQWRTGKKEWKRFESEFEGYVIGERTLSNGTAEYTDEGVFYNPDEYFKAYIVVFNIYQNPVHVLPKDIM
jgi:hypothetical protein